MPATTASHASVLDPQPAPTGAQWGEHGSWQWQEHTCHWRVLGNKRHPALVLIHGFGAASGHWRHNAAELAAAGWCVYAIDLVGFGASSQPGHRRHRPLDNRLWARQLQGFLEQVVPLELLVPLIARTPLLDLGLRSAYSDPTSVDRELRRLVARPALRPRAARALRAMSIGMALRPRGATAAVLLERMQQPLLVLWGSHDRLVPPMISERLQRHKGDLELQLLPQLGHCPHDEQPELFNRHVLGWLARNLGTTQPREQPWA
ncbi:MAG: alpha/beta fold hydrolase [Vulcanococcus sp.]